MSPEIIWPWIALLLLGAVHGLNPGMGWLFAVALGMQEGRRRAVWRALLPLAAGHAVAITVVLVLATVIGVAVPLGVLKWIVAGALVVLGISQLLRHRHFAWGGMRVGARDLAIWSFLMATAHGAGLMALPFALQARATSEAVVAHGSHAGHMSPVAGGSHANHMLSHAGLAAVPDVGTSALLATSVHAAGYLLLTGLIAVIVYERLGLALLRRAWVNIDRIWAGALIATAALTVLL